MSSSDAKKGRAEAGQVLWQWYSQGDLWCIIRRRDVKLVLRDRNGGGNKNNLQSRPMWQNARTILQLIAAGWTLTRTVALIPIVLLGFGKVFTFTAIRGWA